jgi:hypothetical protein
MTIRSVLFVMTAIVVVPFMAPGLFRFIELMMHHGEMFWSQVFGG